MTPSHDIIDLRSDTVTRPTPAMREAMARAEVGDDVYGEDPTVNRLQEVVAARLGKEAALFVPSGTMANQVSIRTHTEPGDEVILDGGGHSYNYESGATAAICGVQVRPIVTETGIFSAAELEAAIRPASDNFPRTRLVCLENTHNRGGGTVWPSDQMRQVAELAHERGLAVHIDGARLFNAEIASGTPAADYAACADSVSICLSKGLGAPVGSVVAGNRAFIERAHRFRKQFGGGMRQAGILAAAGLYALEHHVTRLAEDHANARRLGERLAATAGLSVDLKRVQTNMVFVHISRPDLDAAALVTRLKAGGVLTNAVGPRSLRLVTHLDVTAEQISAACERMRAALG